MLTKIKAFAAKLKKQRQEKPYLAWPLQLIALGASLGFIAIFSFVFLIWIGAFGQLPTETQLVDIQNNVASEVYSADGKVLGKYYRENRINIAYEDISPYLIDALIATEDSRFFEHKGIDLRSWGRVLYRTVLLQDLSGGGGSTLSQQLAKNIFPRRKGRLGTAVAKIKEMFTARRLERIYSKDELLNLYLNKVPFGGNVYGVQVAAKTFFNTNAKDIKIEEAAVLIGMLKANTYYNPVRNPNSSKQRRNVVLSQMEKQGVIQAEEKDSLQALDLIVDYRRENNSEGLATYFRENLRQKLPDIVGQYHKPDGTPYNLYTDGLKIYTSINARLQGYAEEAVHQHMEQLQKKFDQHWKGRKPWGDDAVIEKAIKRSHRYKQMKEAGKSEEEIKDAFDTPVGMTVFSYKGDVVKEMSPRDSIQYYFCLLNAGFIATNPSTGEVLAWVGGIDHQYFKYDHVKSKRQVGSTFKPIVYATALKQGVPPCQYVNNRLVTYTEYDDWQPQNSGFDYGGVLSMEGALRNSVNSVAVDLIMRAGVDPVRQLAKEMGVSADIPQVPAIALGAVDVALYDMVQVYGTFANRGVKVSPQDLLRIENSAGEIIAEFKPEKEPQRVLSIDETDMMTHMMSAVVDSGTARRLRLAYNLQNDIAGKTGTTQSHADGWFMGYTPTIAAGAWVGGESPQVRFRSISLGQGANTALPIWAEFMKRVYQDKEFRKWKSAKFPAPSVAVAEALNCIPYLDEEPVLIAEEEILPGSDEEGFYDKLDALLGSFKKKKDKEPVNTSPRKKNDQKSNAQKKESERIKKKNERTRKKKERKEKRKKKWNDLMKKD